MRETAARLANPHQNRPIFSALSRTVPMQTSGGTFGAFVMQSSHTEASWSLAPQALKGLHVGAALKPSFLAFSAAFLACPFRACTVLGAHGGSPSGLAPTPWLAKKPHNGSHGATAACVVGQPRLAHGPGPDGGRTPSGKSARKK
eukprot:CAMPEP_0194495000 /NCGR_PEP_ID=MMETSP0253-20130528/12736_1 /TAXON_ID=2966 /ORGANISM="Noctiluca scintillans" /LENGTH=144 /DNA_ID=CAMNT_0039336191 /DNA_START=69 /DNA_END=504 /DNA_ORIENTATION=+